MNPRSLMLSAILVYFSTSTLTFASNEYLERQKVAAAQGRTKIAEIAAKQIVSTEDLEFLTNYLHKSGVSHKEIPGDALVPLAQAAFAQMSNKSPEAFFMFLAQNKNDLVIFPYKVADLILASMSGSDPGMMMRALFEFNLINSEAIERAMDRDTGYNPFYAGFGSSGRVSIDVIDKNMAAQLPDKLRIAIELYDVGVRSEHINEIFIEAIGHNGLASNLKIAAMERIGKSGTTYVKLAVDALKKSVMPPFVFGATTVDEAKIIRTTAVQAIINLKSQESVDALWEIAGLNTRTTSNGRPLPDTPAVIRLAKDGRKILLSNGEFKNRSIFERMGRAISCGILLSK